LLHITQEGSNRGIPTNTQEASTYLLVLLKPKGSLNDSRCTVHIDVEVTDEAFVHDCGTSLHTYVLHMLYMLTYICTYAYICIMYAYIYIAIPVCSLCRTGQL